MVTSSDPPPTGSDEGPAPSPWRIRVARFWPLLVGVAIVVALLNDTTDLAGKVFPTDNRPMAVTSAPPAPAPSANSSSTSSSAAGGPQAGDCLDDGDQITSCEDGHRREVIGTGATADECTTNVLVGYLGGRSDIDVLGTRITASRSIVGGLPVCLAVVASPAVRGSVAGTLQRLGVGDAWRRCHDSGTDDDVACSQPHTGEYVSWTSGETDSTSATCEELASAYTDTPYQALAGDLEVTTVRNGTGEGCRLDLRSQGSLGKSLRGLGARALPLVS